MPTAAKKKAKVKTMKKKPKVWIDYPQQGVPVPRDNFPAFGRCNPPLKKVYAVLYSKKHQNIWHGTAPSGQAAPGTWAVLFSSVGLATNLTLEIYDRKGGRLLARRKGIDVVAPSDLLGIRDDLQKPFSPRDNDHIMTSLTAWGIAVAPVNGIDTSDDKTVMTSGAEVAHGTIMNNPTAMYNVYMVQFTVAGNKTYAMKITDTGGVEVDVINLQNP